MTHEEILEYNRRCAEFLGMYDYSIDNEYFEEGKAFCYPEKYKNPGCGYWTVLQKHSDGSFTGIFNSDWNWIMDVVEAIEKLKFRFEIALNETNLYCISEERRFSYAINYHDCENYGEETRLTKKEAVVKTIDHFLIWYNENSKNTMV